MTRCLPSTACKPNPRLPANQNLEPSTPFCLLTRELSSTRRDSTLLVFFVPNRVKKIRRCVGRSRGNRSDHTKQCNRFPRLAIYTHAWVKPNRASFLILYNNAEGNMREKRGREDHSQPLPGTIFVRHLRSQNAFLESTPRSRPFSPETLSQKPHNDYCGACLSCNLHGRPIHTITRQSSATRAAGASDACKMTRLPIRRGSQPALPACTTPRTHRLRTHGRNTTGGAQTGQIETRGRG